MRCLFSMHPRLNTPLYIIVGICFFGAVTGQVQFEITRQTDPQIFTSKFNNYDCEKYCFKACIEYFGDFGSAQEFRRCSKANQHCNCRNEIFEEAKQIVKISAAVIISIVVIGFIFCIGGIALGIFCWNRHRARSRRQYNNAASYSTTDQPQTSSAPFTPINTGNVYPNPYQSTH